MLIISNPQAIMFVELSTAPSGGNQLSSWLGQQQLGQSRTLLTDIICKNKGTVTHTVADAVLCSFPTVRTALSCISDIWETFSKPSEELGDTTYQVQIGLSYGKFNIAAGKISGKTVTDAGVLHEAAGPNQVLVTQAVFDAASVMSEFPFVASEPVNGEATYVLNLDQDASGTSQHTEPHAETRTEVTPAETPRTPASEPAAKPIAPVSAPTQYSLSLTYQDQSLRFGPENQSFVIGRNQACDIVINDKFVSRKHARIEWQDGVPHLINLSDNGSCIAFSGDPEEFECSQAIALTGSGKIGLASSFILSKGNVIEFKQEDGAA